MGDQAELANASDEVLARRVMAGERVAEAALFRRFAPRVQLYGLRHLRGRSAADDLVQRVMMLAIEKLRSGAVQQPERIGSFVLGTARTMVRETRRPSRTEPIGRAHEALPAPQRQDPEPLGRAQLATCLDALPERDRSIIIMSFYHEQDSAEIGRALGMHTGHVRVVRHRAIVQLRTCMGVEEEATSWRHAP